MIIAFTGHRPAKLGGYGPSPTQERIRAALRREILALQPSGAISGVALGVDQWAAEVCNELGIRWIAAVPFGGQEQIWPAAAQARYQELLATAAKVVIVSPGGFTKKKLQVRNEWMVDRAGVLLAVWDGSAGGTGNCVLYARQRSRRIITIHAQGP